ncbi:MAG TPA: tRNA uridine-5-carboxymethylaminomethyl(34) synthesis GTPase MnmE [Trueperaceae bacterium]
MALPPSNDTIAAIATAPGVGAVGIVRVSGPNTWMLADRVFRPLAGPSPSRLPPARVTLGRIFDDERLIDEALLLNFRAPHSYTGQDLIELQTHGGPAVLREVLEVCLRNGARLAGPGEFTLRAYLSGRIDLVQAESVLSLVNAQSETARRQAALGLSRALSERLDLIQNQLTRVFGNLQAVFDYPDEGVPESERREPLESALAQVDELLATARAGDMAVRGARIALVGRPNAGKSSLLNALLGYERSLVSDTPGTTRDYLEAPLTLAGIPVTAIDTAGIRDTGDAIEASGVSRARDLAAQADLVLCLLDSSAPLGEEELELARSLDPQRTLLVASKSDLAAAWSDPPGTKPLRVSTITGEGQAALKEAIREHLTGDAGSSELWITSERHAQALRLAREHVERALDAPDDLAALDLEEALRALATITGREGIAEEALEHIFANFCVGK